MTFLEKIELMRRVDQLIRLKGTGTAEELAKRLGIGRSSVYELVESMRTLGVEIEYCRDRQSFYYTNSNVIVFGSIDPSKITGGKNNFQNFDTFFALSRNFGQSAFIIAQDLQVEGYSPNPWIEEVKNKTKKNEE